MRKFLNSGTGICFLLIATGCMKPIARFEMSADKKEAPATVTFKNESENADSFQWKFGDGAESTEQDAIHKYNHSGTYEVSLTAMKGEKSNTLVKPLIIDPSPICMIEIITEYGTMVAELYDATPQHRDNFLKLAEEGFYDGLLFHRVIDGFMIQGGDPDSRNAQPGAPLGSGSPGYMVPAEFVDSLIHIKGAIAAARTGDNVNPEKKSSGSQFYIVQGSPVDENMLKGLERRKGITYTEKQKELYAELGGTPFLDRDYTVFGRVIKGLEVIDKIAQVEKDARDRPKKDVKMTIKVIR